MTDRLTVLCWDHPRCTGPVRHAATLWQQQHPGAQVVVEERPLAAFNDEPLEAIARRADLLFIDHPMVGGCARSGALVPLDDLLPTASLQALAHDSVGRSHDSYRWGGRQWALAVDAACQVAVVDPARAQAQLPLGVPRTWTEVLAAARERPGSVGIPLYPTDAVLSLLSIAKGLHAAGLHADDFWPFEAVELLAELASLVHPMCFELNPPGMLDALAAGPADEVPVYAPLLFGYTNYQRPSAAGRRLRFLDVPGAGADPTPAGAVLGGAGLAVSAYSVAPAPAAEFALWLAGAEAQRTVVLPHGGQPASRSLWLDPAADQVVGGFFSGTRATIENSFLRPRDAWWPTYQDRAGRLLADLLRRREDPGRIHDELSEMLRTAQTEETVL